MIISSYHPIDAIIDRKFLFDREIQLRSVITVVTIIITTTIISHISKFPRTREIQLSSMKPQSAAKPLFNNNSNLSLVVDGLAIDDIMHII